MTINGHNLKTTIAAYDGCHKIYIPVDGQENEFIERMMMIGWDYPEQFFKITKASDLMKMFLDSCPLRFIQQINCSGEGETYISIIDQFEFTTDDGDFDIRVAKKVFRA